MLETIIELMTFIEEDRGYFYTKDRGTGEEFMYKEDGRGWRFSICGEVEKCGASFPMSMAPFLLTKINLEYFHAELLSSVMSAGMYHESRLEAIKGLVGIAQYRASVDNFKNNLITAIKKALNPKPTLKVIK